MTLNILLKEMDTALLFFFPSLIFTQPFWYQSVPQSSTQLLKSPVDRVAYLVSECSVNSKKGKVQPQISTFVNKSIILYKNTIIKAIKSINRRDKEGSLSHPYSVYLSFNFLFIFSS